MPSPRTLPALALIAAVLPLSAIAQVPRPAPDFAINLPGGKQLRLSQYKGKPIALVFILTTCSHCQRAAGILSKMQREYGPRGLQVLGSATEEMAVAALPGFLRQFDPPFPVGTNTLDQFTTFVQHSTMTRLLMPGLVFIDKSGIIQAQYEGGDPFFEESAAEKNIRAKIESLLAPPVAPAKKSAPKKAAAKKTN